MNDDRKYKARAIQNNATLIDALKHMDRIDQKLLLVFQRETFAGVLSIGDIQRAILQKLPMDTAIHKVMREDITCAHVHEPFETIKQRMFMHRTECMPVLDDQNELVDVYFWDDVFEPGKESLKRQINLPVVIMAGGEGTRLRPLTHILPKPLLPLGEKTLLESIMDRFIEFGCDEFYLSVNHKSDFIKYYFSNLSKKKYRITFFEEDKPLGTAGSLSLLKNRIDRPFFVSNCDILVDIDYADLYNYHQKNGNELTILSALKHFPIIYGTMETGPNGQLLDIKEKPEITIQINTGVYLLEPQVIDLVPGNRFYHITELIDDLRQANRNVGVFPVNSGSWKDFGTWDEYLKYMR